MCNLACKYCFYCDVIESRNMQMFQKQLWMLTHKRLILQALEYANGDEIYFAFKVETTTCNINYYQIFKN